MSCNCMTISKEKRSYENVKKLAKKWAEFHQEFVVIYQQMDGSFDFLSAENPEAEGKEVVEMVSFL